jgi:hypothetical protein
VTIAGGCYTLTTIRDITQGLRLGNLARLPRPTGQERPAAELPGSILTALIQARSCLEAALGQPAKSTRQHVTAALGSLDNALDEIHGIRSAAAPSRERA